MDLARKENQEAAATRMAELRGHFRHTQQECADALGIGQSSYAEMEAGNSRIRRRDMVTIAVHYGLPLSEAFPGLLQDVERPGLPRAS